MNETNYTLRRIYIQLRKEFLGVDESNWVIVGNLQNTGLPKTRERGIPKTQIILTNLLSRYLQVDTSFEIENGTNKRDRKGLILIVKGKKF